MMGFGFLGVFVVLGFFGLLLVGGIAFAFGQNREMPLRAGGDRLTPRQIADARLARGEISLEEYKEIRERIAER